MKEYFYKTPVQAIQFNGEYTEEIKAWIELEECFGELDYEFADGDIDPNENVVVGLRIYGSYNSDYVRIGDYIVLDSGGNLPFTCYSEGVFKDELQTLEELESKVVSKFMDSAKTRFGEFKHQFGLHDIGRSLFPIQEMPEGALPIYDKDCDKRIIINGSEYIIGSQSISFEKIVELDEINKGFTNPNDLGQIRMSCKSSMDDKFETFLTQGDSVPVIDGMVFWATAATPVPITKEDFPNTFLDDFGNIRIGED
jgi:hypothetical protein